VRRHHLTGIVTDAATRERLRQRDVTVIETWGIPEEPIDIAVGYSHTAVGRDIARFLLGRGYTRPLLTVANGVRARQRRDGIIDEWTSAGRKAPDVVDVPLPTRFGHSRWCGGRWHSETRMSSSAVPTCSRRA
jgi:LacI family gluconate utilization system Gnt-I transcriptional repressor